MKKRIVAVTCVLMFCLGLIGCGTERADKTQQLIRGAAPGYNDGLIRVGMIQTGKESDWRDANTNDYLNTFTKERGYDLIYIDGNSSSERQVKAMYDLIQQKVDYIILQPIVETGWGPPAVLLTCTFFTPVPYWISISSVSPLSSPAVCWGKITSSYWCMVLGRSVWTCPSGASHMPKEPRSSRSLLSRTPTK